MSSQTYLNSIIYAAIVLFGSGGYARAGTWTTIDKAGAYGTQINGISGNNLIGGDRVSSGVGFLYNLTSESWTTISFPGAGSTTVTGIDGSNIVGYYGGSDDKEHGFVYNVPEPAALLLLGLGAVTLRRKR
jgi:hypothetical protein